MIVSALIKNSYTMQTLQILATKFSQLLLESYSIHKKDRRVEVTPLACSQQVKEPGFGTQQSESSALILLCATLLYTIRLQISIGVIFPIKTFFIKVALQEGLLSATYIAY